MSKNVSTECPSPWLESAGCLAGHWTRPAALCLHQHVHHQVVQNIISLEMRLFTRSYICSASATRNFVHSVSTLFEIILLVLLGNDLSTITRGNGETYPFPKICKIEHQAPMKQWFLGWLGWQLSSLRASSPASSPPPSSPGSPQRNVFKLTTLHLSLHATLGTIDTRWLAIVVLGGLRGPGTYGGRLKRDSCLIFSSSSALPHLRPQSCSRRCGELQREAFQEGDQLRHRFDPPAPRSPDTSVFEASLEFSENFDCRC